MPSRATPAVPSPALADPNAGSVGSARASASGLQAGPAPTPGAAVRRLASEAVFDGAAEVLICHRGVDYRLRQTTLGKLILTK